MLAHVARIGNLCLWSSLLLLSVGAFAQTSEPWSGTYAYDGAGNIKAIGRNHYVYDGVNRLRQGTAITPAQQSVQGYTYDAFGNMRGMTTDADAAHAFVVGVNSGTNRADDPSACSGPVTCFLGTYDEAGAQTTFGSTAYSFDTSYMLTESRSMNRDQLFIYDADDERVALVDYAGANSQTWHYTLRDLGQSLVREVDDSYSAGTHSWKWKKDYVNREASPFTAISPDDSGGETKVHFHLDHLGTVRLATGSGARKLGMHTYWPFGREALGSDVDDETVKFGGHERDSANDGNDLDYIHARFYPSNAGRFLSVDPGDDAQSEQPQSWNQYAYVRNNPISSFDPDGASVWSIGVQTTGEAGGYLAQGFSFNVDSSLHASISETHAWGGGMFGGGWSGQIGYQKNGGVQDLKGTSPVIGLSVLCVGAEISPDGRGGVSSYSVGAGSPTKGAPLEVHAAAATTNNLYTFSLLRPLLTLTIAAIDAAQTLTGTKPATPPAPTTPAPAQKKKKPAPAPAPPPQVKPKPKPAPPPPPPVPVKKKK